MTMSRGRIVRRTILLLLGVGLAVSACATEAAGYGPDYYGYYGYYGGDGFVFAPGHGRFHDHRGHGFAHGFGDHGVGGHGVGGHGHAGFAGHGGCAGHGAGAHGGAGGHGGGGGDGG